jgi:hypothetical protein
MVRGIEVLASVGDMLEHDPITIVNGPDLSAEHGVRSLLWGADALCRPYQTGS